MVTRGSRWPLMIDPQGQVRFVRFLRGRFYQLSVDETIRTCMKQSYRSTYVCRGVDQTEVLTKRRSQRTSSTRHRTPNPCTLLQPRRLLHPSAGVVHVCRHFSHSRFGTPRANVTSPGEQVDQSHGGERLDSCRSQHQGFPAADGQLHPVRPAVPPPGTAIVDLLTTPPLLIAMCRTDGTCYCFVLVLSPLLSSRPSVSSQALLVRACSRSRIGRGLLTEERSWVGNPDNLHVTQPASGMLHVFFGMPAG